MLARDGLVVAVVPQEQLVQARRLDGKAPDAGGVDESNRLVELIGTDGEPRLDASVDLTGGEVLQPGDRFQGSDGGCG